MRDKVVAEVRSWVRTPYHHDAKVKGAGVDCAQVILQTFINVGIIDPVDISGYTHDWHLHRNEEAYLAVVESYLDPLVDEEFSFNDRPDFVAGPGDVVVWRVGRTFSHGAIVTDWPRIVHSYYPARMVEEIDLTGTPIAKRVMRAYTYRGYT